MLKAPPPLTAKQWKFVEEQLRKEEQNPDPVRIRRLHDAVANAKKIKTYYHQKTSIGRQDQCDEGD